MAPRQGRQPAVQSRPSASSAKSKKSKSKSKGAKPAKDAAKEEQNLDIYSYSSSIKKPRGDVDPESRPQKKSNLKGKGKGKGKGRQRDDDDEGEGAEEGSDADEDDDQDEDGDEMILPGGDEVVEFTGMKPAGLYMGGGDDDGDDDGGAGIRSEDDEEIDSDEAYEDEDDLPALPKKRKGSKVSSQSPLSCRSATGKKLTLSLLQASSSKERFQIDLDESEEDPNDEEGGAYMDASEMLDMGEFDSDDSEQAQDDAPTRGPFDSEEEEQDSESGSGSEDDEDDEDDEEVDSEDDEEYAGALEKLNSFVEGLESKKRKVDDEDEEGGKKKKRVVLKERTEAWPEGEFVAVTAPDGVNQGELVVSVLSTPKD